MKQAGVRLRIWFGLNVKEKTIRNNNNSNDAKKYVWSDIFELPIWLSHSCIAPIMQKKAQMLRCRKRRNLLYFSWRNTKKRIFRNRKKRRKNWIVSKLCAIKNIEESLEIYGIDAFGELIVYRICALARKHVNQLNSTRFPNAIEEEREEKKTNTSAQNIICGMLMWPYSFYYCSEYLDCAKGFHFCWNSLCVCVFFLVLFRFVLFAVAVLLLDINSDMFAQFSRMFSIFHEPSCCAFNFVSTFA